MHPLLVPPADPALRAAWRLQLHQWRSVTRELMGYNGGSYQQPAFAWISRTFALGFLMLFDQRVYDPATGQYRIENLLDEAEADFGGFDAIVLWHAYPKIGFDARNQFDFYRDTVGGLAGLRALVERCQARGVRVYLDYNPWDHGTRREGQSDSDALAELVAASHADALFLDTLAQAADGLREKLDAARPGVVLESEHLLPVEQLETHHASWAQGIPAGMGVLRNKWFERRHMQHRVKRWQFDHTEELHLAWMNGAGVVVWENVFGTDRRWSARDRSILRAMLPIQRRYAPVFTGEGWEPFVPTAHASLWASIWEGDGIRLWTLCNQTDAPYAGPLITVDNTGSEPIYDLIRGIQIEPTASGDVSGLIAARGVGALITGQPEQLGADFQLFLAGQRALHDRADFDATPPTRVEVLTSAPRTRPYSRENLPAGMVLVPGRTFDLRVEFQVRECGFYGYGTGDRPSLDLRYRNLHHHQSFTRPIQVNDFAIDLTPVTNQQYAIFLQESGYHPRHTEHFLDHWPDGQLPATLEDHPVVYVDLDDARAYARWAHKRLPTEEEWQHAAQGFEERVYPWGDTYLPENCNHGSGGTTTPVSHYPQGRSPFGCFDLCGNVWEMTESERSDGQTRFMLLKGGSFYRALGSEWYTDGGPQPNALSAKMILSWPGLDRCATIGFRCVVDL